MAHCVECGNKLRANAGFCNKCGMPVKNSSSSSHHKKKRNNPKANMGKSPPRKQRPPKASKKQGEFRENTPIPERFLPLLKYIGAKTLKTFFKRLPMSIGIGLAAWVLHTFLLVYVNEGFGTGNTVGNFLALENRVFSGTIIWIVGSVILMGILTRKSGGHTSVSLSDRIVAIKRYIANNPMDAWSVLTGGIGVAFLISTFTTSTASLALAIGMGTLIASRAGSTISLLFRTTWNTFFSTMRHKQVCQYGMAAGYTGMFASSLGFVANSVLPVGGLFAGIILVGVAIALGIKGRQSNVINGFLLFFITPTLLYLFGDAGLVFADDGGWREAGGTFSEWIRYPGAMQAVMMGAGPAIGAAFGAAMGRTLIDIDNALPSNGLDDLNGTTDQETNRVSPDYYDKEGEPFERNDEGEYWAPDDKGNWRWLGEKDAREAEAALRGENIQRQREREHHDRETQKNLDRSRQKIRAQIEAEQQAEAARLARHELRQKKLAEQLAKEEADAAQLEREAEAKAEVDKLAGDDRKKALADAILDAESKEDDENTDQPLPEDKGDKQKGEANEYEDEYEDEDEDEDKLTPPLTSPKLSPRTALEEFYDRIDYLNEHSHELSDGQNKAIKKIIERTGYKNGTIHRDDLSDEDRENIRRLTKSVSDSLQGDSEAEGAQAQHDAAAAQLAEDASSNVAYVGEQAAMVVEDVATGGRTNGAISAALFAAARNHDKSLPRMLDEMDYAASHTFAGNALSGAKDNGAWRWATNTAWGSGKEAAEDGDARETLNSGMENSFWGEVRDLAAKAIKRKMKIG